MAGLVRLVPAIHAFVYCDIRKDVDARHKAGHDQFSHFPKASRIFAWIFAMPAIQRS